MAVGVNHPVPDQATQPRLVVVWDPLVRIGHWLLVLFFFTAYFTEDDLLTAHSWAGYGIAVYVVIRVIWGFVGPRYARFADFAYNPLAALRYVLALLSFRAERHIGHSPAGGVMVFAFLISLSATTVSGMALLAVEENAGPLAPWLGGGVGRQQPAAGPALVFATARADERDRSERDDERGEALEEIHELLSNLTLMLVILHIAGIGLASLVHRENLTWAMITGRKRLD